MNKYRILTTDGQWLYTTLKAVEDRLLNPWLDKHGQQMLDPRVKFRPETFGHYVFTWKENFPKKSIRLYEGDIVEAVRTDDYIKKGRLYLLMPSYPYAISAKPYPEGVYSLNLEREMDYVPLGNIFENPELLGNPELLEEK